MAPLILFFVLGATLGSYLFTTAQRLADNQSLGGFSSCDYCHTRPPVWALLPILGYLLTQGRCRHCQGHISLWYPFSELIFGLLVLGLYARLGWGWDLAYHLGLLCLLTLIALVDARTQEILLGPVLAALALRGLWLWQMEPEKGLESLLGLLLGAGVFHWVSTLFLYLRKKEGLGAGDATLLGLLGWILGWQSLLALVFVSSLLGVIAGTLVLALKKEGFGKEIAFGPWLILSSLIIWAFPSWLETFMPF